MIERYRIEAKCGSAVSGGSSFVQDGNSPEEAVRKLLETLGDSFTNSNLEVIGVYLDSASDKYLYNN